MPVGENNEETYFFGAGVLFGWSTLACCQVTRSWLSQIHQSFITKFLFSGLKSCVAYIQKDVVPLYENTCTCGSTRSIKWNKQRQKLFFEQGVLLI